jgi:AAA+ superfamily predicted ATPase
MTAGLRAARAIGQAAALDPWRGEEVLPGAVVHDDDSVRDYLYKNLRATPLDPDDHRRMSRVARLMGDRHGLVLSGQLPQR